MTPAELVAEALCHAEKVTPVLLGEHFRISIEDEAGQADDYLDSLRGNIEQRLDEEGRYPFVRWDCMATALAHLAARVVAERERAEGAEDLQRRAEQMWRAERDSAEEWRGRCQSTKRLGRALKESEDRRVTAESKNVLLRETLEMLGRENDRLKKEAGEGVGRG